MDSALDLLTMAASTNARASSIVDSQGAMSRNPGILIALGAALFEGTLLVTVGHVEPLTVVDGQLTRL